MVGHALQLSKQFVTNKALIECQTKALRRITAVHYDKVKEDRKLRDQGMQHTMEIHEKLKSIDTEKAQIVQAMSAPDVAHLVDDQIKMDAEWQVSQITHPFNQKECEGFRASFRASMWCLV